MSQVSTLIEAHRKYRVARVEQGLIDGHVGVGSAVRLHIGVIGTKKSRQSAPSKVFDLVNHLVASVVATTGVTLGILVGED